MIQLLEDYFCKSLPEWGDFFTNPNLARKVSHTGAFLTFYGFLTAQIKEPLMNKDTENKLWPTVNG